MILLTENGILRTDKSTVTTPFESSLVHRGTSNEDKLAVIVERHQIWLFDRNLQQWEKLMESEWELNCVLWVGDQLLVGTKEARLAWVEDGTLNFITSFDEVDNRSKWSTPWGGPPDVRSLAKSDDQYIFANIHVGWIVRSTDGGSTWEGVSNDLHKDVHHVVTHPTDNSIVLAATAGGLHISRDQGLNFEKWWSRQPTYQRTAAAFPGNTYLCSVSAGPSGRGAKLFRAEEGGTWQEVSGLPSLDTNINTYQLTILDDHTAVVVTKNSTVYQSDDTGNTWEPLVSDLPKTYQLVDFQL